MSDIRFTPIVRRIMIAFLSLPLSVLVHYSPEPLGIAVAKRLGAHDLGTVAERGEPAVEDGALAHGNGHGRGPAIIGRYGGHVAAETVHDHVHQIGVNLDRRDDALAVVHPEGRSGRLVGVVTRDDLGGLTAQAPTYAEVNEESSAEQ